MSLGTELATVFRRDLTRLTQQVCAFPDNESLWMTVPGITNSAGNLVLHIDGNLREYVGRQLGHRAFDRNRPLEFSTSGLAREELADRVNELESLITSVLARLSDDQLAEAYPEEFQGVALTARQMLMHLNGHLQWHSGQVDYLRRILTAGAALELAGFQGTNVRNDA